MYNYARDVEQMEDDIIYELLCELDRDNGGTSPRTESIYNLNEEIYGTEDNDTD